MTVSVGVAKSLVETGTAGASVVAAAGAGGTLGGSEVAVAAGKGPPVQPTATHAAIMTTRAATPAEPTFDPLGAKAFSPTHRDIQREYTPSLHPLTVEVRKIVRLGSQGVCPTRRTVMASRRDIADPNLLPLVCGLTASRVLEIQAPVHTQLPSDCPNEEASEPDPKDRLPPGTLLESGSLSLKLLPSTRPKSGARSRGEDSDDNEIRNKYQIAKIPDWSDFRRVGDRLGRVVRLRR